MRLIDNFNEQGFRILPNISKDLEESINRVIDKCKLLNTTPQEPDFIADLVINFSKKLHENLKIHLPNFDWSVTGIYCHQKPIVNIGSKVNPELGDLMLVFIHTDEFGRKHLNSLLLQAKKNVTINYTVANNESHQLKLYEEWSDFKYQRAGKLNGVERKILPKIHHSGGRYLIISQEAGLVLPFAQNQSFYYGVAVPNRNIVVSMQFDICLIHFMKFILGRTFELDSTKTDDDWTKVVWDLIDVAKQKVSRRRNSGLATFPRNSTHTSDGLAFMENTSNSIFYQLSQEVGNGNNDEEYYIENSDGGIPMLIIESQISN